MRQDCRGLILIFDKVEEGVVGEGLSEYLYLLIFMNLRPGHLKNQLESINIKVDKDNGKSVGMVKGRARKFWRFSRNEFWKNIGCLVSAPNFGLGGLMRWDNKEEQNISGNNSKIHSIRVKIYLYWVCLYFIIHCPLFNIMTILIPFPPARFVASLTPGEMSSGIIGHKN